MVEVLCSQIEQAKGLSRTVGLEALIETALGMANVETIAQSSRRLEALHLAWPIMPPVVAPGRWLLAG